MGKTRKMLCCYPKDGSTWLDNQREAIYQEIHRWPGFCAANHEVMAKQMALMALIIPETSRCQQHLTHSVATP
jgi:hypothetical protein